MKNVRTSFEAHDGDLKDLVGCQKIECHMIFDIKLGENFRRKARLVVGGHVTSVPSTMCCSFVVSRESVRLALLAAALNELDIILCDMQNAYLSAPCREKTHCRAGSKFGSEAGKKMIIKMVLCGSKSSSAAFRTMLANVMCELGFRLSKADPNACLKPLTKPNRFRHCAMLLVCSDDALSRSHEPFKAINCVK